MERFVFDKVVDGSQLMTELHNAGLDYITDVSFTDRDVSISAEKVDEITVAAIVAAHNLVGIQNERALEKTRLSQGRQLLRTYLDIPAPTAAQSAAALKVLIKILSAELREDVLEPPPAPPVSNRFL